MAKINAAEYFLMYMTMSINYILERIDIETLCSNAPATF